MYTLSGSLAPLSSIRGEDFDDLELGGLISCPAPMRSFLFSKLAAQRPLLVVCATNVEADTLRDDIAAYVGDEAVHIFGAWETLPHERLSPQVATVGKRLRTLHALKSGEARVVVAPVRALLQPMDRRIVDREPLVLNAFYEGGLEGMVEHLATLGYQRSSLVYEPGEFAVRGGIVDVFGAGATEPVRVEFFGDDVDELRVFSVEDQRTLESVEEVVVHPARELVLDDYTRALAEEKIAEYPHLKETLTKLSDGVAVEGAEGLLLSLLEDPVFISEVMPIDAGLVIADNEQVFDRAEQLVEQARQLAVADWQILLNRLDLSEEESQEQAPLDYVDNRSGFGSLDTIIENHQKRSISMGAEAGKLWRTTPFNSPNSNFNFTVRPFDTWRGRIPDLAETLKQLVKDNRTVVSVKDHGSALRIADALRSYGLKVDHIKTGEKPATTINNRVQLVQSSLRTGFHSRNLRLVLIGEFDVFGPRRTSVKRRIGSTKASLQTIYDLEIGDPLVHSVHGIGLYGGMQTRTFKSSYSGEVTRDYVLVEYAAGDRLYVPSDQVDSLAVYSGGENPRIMRMGGADWERAKSKVKEAVKKMAADLMRLYSARLTVEGHAFVPDAELLHKLEDSFPWVETPDQLEAIAAVKEDMSTPLPMDRLICGDVGFGKTEVAVRAAAVAVFDNHQAAILVPTTLLAQQHGETFIERFASTGVNVKVLSRFSTAKETAEITKGLKDGTVDIVVGTHRILSKDIEFANLGLLVIDEEQRFGVAHKERMKELKTSVDVLTMSATPIPRTMEMAITGIRDMSTIETPPMDRQPVITQVSEWDEDMAILAIRRELLREGQVFWLHNNVKTIHAVADRIKELVPEARVAVGHGQMDEDDLEKVMLDFWTKDIDVLVATTIIENGIDIPNANTLVVENADRLGMAQLYQLRGRVGRSTVRGYAHLFYEGQPTPEAYKRLESIATHTHLGAGMSVALKDLEIRGAGSMLGADQSGTVSGVGFDTYTQLVQQAVSELGGVPQAEEEPELHIDLPVDGFLPSDWISDEALRLQAYRRIANIRSSYDVKDVMAELEDRYGKLPEPAEKLINLAAFKTMLRMWGITDIATTPRRTVRISPVTLSDSRQVHLARKYPKAQWNPTGKVLEIPTANKSFSNDPVSWLAKRLVNILGAPK